MAKNCSGNLLEAFNRARVEGDQQAARANLGQQGNAANSYRRLWPSSPEILDTSSTFRRNVDNSRVRLHYSGWPKTQLPVSLDVPFRENNLFAKIFETENEASHQKGPANFPRQQPPALPHSEDSSKEDAEVAFYLKTVENSKSWKFHPIEKDREEKVHEFMFLKEEQKPFKIDAGKIVQDEAKGLVIVIPDAKPRAASVHFLECSNDSFVEDSDDEKDSNFENNCGDQITPEELIELDKDIEEIQADQANEFIEIPPMFKYDPNDEDEGQELARPPPLLISMETYRKSSKEEIDRMYEDHRRQEYFFGLRRKWIDAIARFTELTKMLNGFSEAHSKENCNACTD